MPPQRVDTFGWDTVYAIKYADVTTAILNSWPSTPVHLNQTSGPASIDGDFGPWSVTTGGSGHLLHMFAPVPALLYNGTTTYNATAEVELQLEFVPQPQMVSASRQKLRGASGGTWHDLRLASGQPASIINVTYTGTAPLAIDQAIIKDLFRQWFNNQTNLQNFNTVFASVNLDAKADVDAFQWLQPTSVGYAVAEEEGLPDGVFAVLCMTENRPATGLAHQVSPYAIPAAGRSALVISSERYLTNLLLPGVGLMFTAPANATNWPAAYFELQSDGATITNTQPLATTLEIDGQACPATIAAGNFTLQVDGSGLAIDIVNMTHQYKLLKLVKLPWLNVSHTIHTTATAALRNGQQFGLNAGSGSQTIVVTKTSVADWTEFGLGIAGLLMLTTGMAVALYRTATVGAAATAGQTLTQTVELTDAAAALPDAAAAADDAAGATGCLAAIGRAPVAVSSFVRGFWTAYRASYFALIGTVVGGIAAVGKVLDKFANITSKNDLPDFNEFAAAVQAPLQWPTGSQFTVTSIDFCGAFQINGNPGFAELTHANGRQQRQHAESR